MPEPTPEKKDEGKGNLPEEVTKVLSEIKEKLDKVKEPPKDEPPAVPSYTDARASLQKRLGYTDEQMAAHEEMIMKSQAPQIEQAGWGRIEKKPDLETYRKEIEAELKLYPQERRTPEIMEKIYHMVKGKHLDSQPPRKNDDTPPARVRSGPGYDGGGSSNMPAGGGEGTATDDEKMSDEEKFIAAKLGVTEKDYAKSRNAGKLIRALQTPSDFKPNSKADVELRRLMGTH